MCDWLRALAAHPRDGATTLSGLSTVVSALAAVVTILVVRNYEPPPAWWTPDLPGCAWRRESPWDSSAGSSRRSSKADAVALVRSSGRPITAIAHELGIGESNLSYWLKKDGEGRAAADPGGFEAQSAESR